MRLIACLKWLLNASDGFKWAICVNGLLGVLKVGISLLFIWVSKHLIDIVTHRADDSLYLYIAYMLVCMIAQILLSVVISRHGVRVETDLRNRLRYRVYEHVMISRWTGKEKMHTGDVQNRLMGDVSTVSSAMCVNIPAVIVTLVQFAGALYFLYLLDAALTAVLLFIMPVALIMSKAYVRRMRRLTHEIREMDSMIQSRIQENLMHRVLMRTMECTETVNGVLVGMQDDLKRRVLRRNNFSVFSRMMVQFGFAGGYATAFLWGIFGLYDGSVTFGMMTAFLQLVAQVQRPVVDLSLQIPALVQVITSVERLHEILVLETEESGDCVKLKGVPGIRFENVSFRYPDGGRMVMDGFSYDFTPGSFTAVVGETGAGKSTMMRMMLALLRPEGGRIVFYDGSEEVEASVGTRCNVSYVPQGNSLISGTIRDNLLLGNAEADDDELKEALYLAVADFVNDLPDGMDTICGEHGAGLSEGQAQRIAIARGLLRKGGVLLLDEPTSSLDSETERVLLERLSRKMQGRTVIMITHRNVDSAECSRVLRIERAVG